MKTTSVHWVTSREGTVGIITRINDQNERQIYISAVDGYNEAVDIKTIEDWGSKLASTTIRTLYDFYYDEKGNLR